MPTPLCHFEFTTPDPDRFKAFYGQVLGWQFDDQSMPGYALIQTGAEPGGGVMKTPPDAPAPALNVYFHVEDLQSTLDLATEHGATLLVPVTEIPSVGWFAMIADPDGTPVGLMKSL